MPRTCTICKNVNRDSIDKDLVEGTSSLRSIADRWSVSKSALIRHRDNDLPNKLTKAKAAQEASEADNLLDQIRELYTRAVAILDDAENSKKLSVALRAIREARGTLELLARVEGQLKDGATINILINPTWISLKAAIFKALKPHGPAKRAVIEAMKEITDA